MKKLLIVFHSQSGHGESLALACYQGAKQCVEQDGNVSVELKRAEQACVDDFLSADLLLLLSPENFASISGGVKDFCDRIFYPIERSGQTAMPYALIITAGNDGSNCARQLQKIFKGVQAKQVQAPVIVYGAPDAAALAQCEEVAMALMAGLEMGIY